MFSERYCTYQNLFIVLLVGTRVVARILVSGSGYDTFRGVRDRVSVRGGREGGLQTESRERKEISKRRTHAKGFVIVQSKRPNTRHICT